MGFLEAILQNISGKTKRSLDTKASTSQSKPSIVDEEFIKDLEADLIRSDLGVRVALDFCDKLKTEHQREKILKENIPKLLEKFLLEAFGKINKNGDIFTLQIKPNILNVILVVGVNGVGKTTSIGKLACKLKQEGHKVLIAAADTFRAAAEEQLDIWAQRAGVDIIRLEEDAKPSTVVYKALEKAQSEGYNVVIIDTAGRLQSKDNLMAELGKLRQVISKNSPAASHCETMLVLDASTGSNAISQAEKFNEATQLNSIILTKFDGSARGGIIFALAYQFQLPVKFIGTGEGINDLQEFRVESFVGKHFK